MFNGPEHASYIQLCRELRLEREFEPGDWYWSGPPREYVSCCHGFKIDRTWSAGCIWLPRLDQWLTMLEEAGVEFVEIGVAWVAPNDVVAEMSAEGAAIKTFYAFDATAIPNTDERIEAPTREEAAARLWMAVAGRTVAPAGTPPPVR